MTAVASPLPIAPESGDRIVKRLTDLPDGLHQNVPSAIYHERIPAIVSRSALDKFTRAPALYWAWLDGAQDAETPAFAMGTALHMALLEPSVFARTYAVEPDFGDCRYSAAKKARDEWRAESAGKTLLSAKDDELVRGMATAVRQHPLAQKMLVGGSAEVTALWRDEATGLRCKARADYHVPERRMLVDVKTTEDARPEAFARSVAKWGYHRQRAFYGDGFAACGAKIEHFVFLVIEKAPPHLISLCVLDLDATARGRASVRVSLNAMAECIKLGEFPGYPTSIETISLPAWAT